MTKATILFQKCIQNAQELGSNDDFMVSRIFFSIQLPDRQIENLHTDIKQPAGGDYEKDTLEVSPPQNLKGIAIDYSVFRNLAEKYYRNLIGSSGSGIRIVGGSNVKMFNNTFCIPMTADIEVETSSIAGW